MMGYHHTTLPTAPVKGLGYWPGTLPATVAMDTEFGVLDDLPAEVDASTGSILSVQIKRLALSREQFVDSVGDDEALRQERLIAARLPEIRRAAYADLIRRDEE